LESKKGELGAERGGESGREEDNAVSCAEVVEDLKWKEGVEVEAVVVLVVLILLADAEVTCGIVKKGREEVGVAG
jgi:hypothetical protein